MGLADGRSEGRNVSVGEGLEGAAVGSVVFFLRLVSTALTSNHFMVTSCTMTAEITAATPTIKRKLRAANK